MASNNLASRVNTSLSDDEGMEGGDPSDTSGLLMERLRAWKHMTGYLENYISAVAKNELSQAKDQEKILKTVMNPLKESHHFDPALGGVVGLFQNLQANTQAQSNLHAEMSKNLFSSTLPMLERLHAEIKNKSKELQSGAGKGSKAVDAARLASQKHIELLGHNTATYDSIGGKVDAKHDPYVLQRGLHHRLNKQVLEENANRQDLIQVQNQFQEFEAHIMTIVQGALNSFNQFMSGGADRQKAMYGDIASGAQNMPLDFEWNGFVKRNGHTLVSPNVPPRSMSNITFPNQNHRATQPLIEGALERKSRGGLGAIKGYSSHYYAVTPSGYLHEYKDDDNYKKDPSPDVSLYLPDSVIGALDGTKFAIKGKDASGGVGKMIGISSDYNFRATGSNEAQQWYSAIQALAGGSSNSVPSSPVESRNVSAQYPPPVTTDVPPAQITEAPQSATTGRMASPVEAPKTASPIIQSTSPVAPTTTTASPTTAASSVKFASTTSPPAPQPGATPVAPMARQTSPPTGADPVPSGQGSHFRKG